MQENSRQKRWNQALCASVRKRERVSIPLQKCGEHAR